MASAKEIPPGGVGKINVTFKTGSKSGEKNQVITVSTNDPENRTVQLKIKALIHVSLEATPDRINFGQIRKGDKSPAKFISLTGEDRAKTDIISVSSNNTYIKAEIEPKVTDDNNKEKQVKISLSPDIKVGRFREQISIKTNHEKMNDLPVFIYGDVVGNITVIPDSLSFGMFKKGGKYERYVRLRAAPGVQFKVLNVNATTPDLKTNLVTVKDGVDYMVKVYLDEKFDKDFLRGSLIIATDNMEQSKINVGVFGKSVGENIDGEKLEALPSSRPPEPK